MPFSWGPLTAAQLPAAIEIEQAGYPADEAASPQGLQFRLDRAGVYFKAATDEATGELLGFICATAVADEDGLTDESMSGHNEAGTTLCIHSVAVRPASWRQGIGSAMVSRYVRDVSRQSPHLKRFLLIAKAPLIPFYAANGFAVTRLSPVVHGQDPWFEMTLDCARVAGAKAVLVDAFTSEAFRGNPATVVLLHEHDPETPAEAWMKGVAADMNSPMTVFMRPSLGGSDSYDARFYMASGATIPLCGHASLCAAEVLLPATTGVSLTLRLSNGKEVGASRLENGEIALTLAAVNLTPAWRPGAQLRAPFSETLLASMGLQLDQVLFVGIAGEKVFLELTPEAFEGVGTPDFNAMVAAMSDSPQHTMVVITTVAPEEAEEHCRSRAFAPMNGLDEDPVCGTAHCALAPYYGKKLGVSEISALQTSARSGRMVVTMHPAQRPTQVTLKGRAVKVAELTVTVPLVAAGIAQD